MATHSSVLAWRIPGTVGPGRPPSMGLHRVGNDLAAAATLTFLRNLYAGQEATVRTGHGTTDWFQIRKGVRQRAHTDK